VKGIIFNLLQDVVTREYGEETWEDLLDESGASGAYTSVGSYPDAEAEALVEAAARKLDTTRAEVLRWFGREAMPLLAKHYPDFFDAHSSARPFVLGVNTIIHAEVRKLYAGADCPHFRIREDAEGVLSMGYASARRLCALAQGFVEGAAAHYGEAVDFQHARCVEHGDGHCEFTIRWLPQAA
jgi:predicted hydrocarbon binding protein